MQKVKRGIYQHFKGRKYEVLGVAAHSETLEEFVVYKALYTSRKFGKNAMWIRPVGMFTEKVKVDGREVPRFKYLRRK